MKNFVKGWALIFAMSTIFVGHARAADEVPLLKDLSAVIALLGLPCGQVVSAKKLKDNDHIATCKDGNRYRVYVNADGRVVADKQ